MTRFRDDSGANGTFFTHSFVVTGFIKQTKHIPNVNIASFLQNETCDCDTLETQPVLLLALVPSIYFLPQVTVAAG